MVEKDCKSGFNLYVPCMFGDEVYGIRRVGNKHTGVGFWVPQKGFVSKIILEKVDKKDTAPTLIITVNGACSGKWGEKIFLNKEEAEAECERRNKSNEDN